MAFDGRGNYRDAMSLMEQEAAEAPAIVAAQIAVHAGQMAQLGRDLRASPPRMVLTCARGSSDHAALYAKYVIETHRRVPVASMAPSIVSVEDAPPRDLSDALVIAISQSGRSPDIVANAAAARAAGARVLALVNVVDSPLADAATDVLPLLAGPERSVAATKSFIASLSAVLHLVSQWADDIALRDAVAGLPDTLERASTLDWSAAIPLLRHATGLFTISRGPGFGVAHEMALKFKETCALHAEAFSAAEVEHGPMAIVSDGFPVLMLAPAGRQASEIVALAKRFAARGARVALAGAEADGTVPLPTLAGLHPAVAPIAWVQSFYPMAAALSSARGLDPDHPPYLNKVTETR